MRRRSLGRAAQDSEENGAGPWGERHTGSVPFHSVAQVPHPRGAGLPPKWCRSPNSPVQVSQLSGAGPIFPIGPAPLESTEATFAVQAPSIKTDLRQGAIGPAPAMRDLRHTGGPQRRGSLLLRQKIGAGRKQWRDLRHAGGPQQRRHCTEDCRTEGRSTQERRAAESRSTQERRPAAWARTQGRRAAEGRST